MLLIRFDLINHDFLTKIIYIRIQRSFEVKKNSFERNVLVFLMMAPLMILVRDMRKNLFFDQLKWRPKLKFKY